MRGQTVKIATYEGTSLLFLLVFTSAVGLNRKPPKPEDLEWQFSDMKL